MFEVIGYITSFLLGSAILFLVGVFVYCRAELFVNTIWITHPVTLVTSKGEKTKLKLKVPFRRDGTLVATPRVWKPLWRWLNKDIIEIELKVKGVMVTIYHPDNEERVDVSWERSPMNHDNVVRF